MIGNDDAQDGRQLAEAEMVTVIERRRAGDPDIADKGAVLAAEVFDHRGFAIDGEKSWHGHAWLTARKGNVKLESGSGKGHTETFVY